MVTVVKKIDPNITPNTASLREMKRISFHHLLVEYPEMEGLRSIPATMEPLTRGAFRKLAIFPPT